jgi:hypothetical protein
LKYGSYKENEMSLILKGVNLPEETNYLRLAIVRSGRDNEVLVFDDITNTLIGEAIQISNPHGRLKDFDADGVHPVIVDGEYMVRVDDLDEIPTILEAEWLDE